jgi:hypothetical protein
MKNMTAKEAEALIRKALFDPGRFTQRADSYNEPLYQWQSRAVMIVLEIE